MDLIVKNLQSEIAIAANGVKKAIRAALDYEGIKKKGKITVCFVDDQKIKKLNKLFLKKNTATDVLSFNMGENNKELVVDIAVSTQTARNNALAFQTSTCYEIFLYVIHGILHALGYDDHTKAQRKLMRRKEEAIISRITRHAHL